MAFTPEQKQRRAQLARDLRMAVTHIGVRSDVAISTLLDGSSNIISALFPRHAHEVSEEALTARMGLLGQALVQLAQEREAAEGRGFQCLGASCPGCSTCDKLVPFPVAR
jgi:hypothetical protein